MNILDLTDLRDRNIGRVLQLQAQSVPDKICLLNGDKRYSFSDVNLIVNRYAHGLQSMGVKKGGRLSIFLPSCVEFLFLAYAANKLGAVWIPVNTDYKGVWLSDTINDSKATVLVIDSSLLSRVEEVAEGLSYGGLLLRDSEGKSHSTDLKATLLSSFDDLSDAEPAAVDIDYGDTSAILWTSGTTGKSKGVMVSHNVWIRSGLNSHNIFGTQEDDVIYNCLPLYNAAAWVANIYRALVAGLPLALDERFSASEFWERIRHYKATETITLGAMHMFLWNLPEKLGDSDNTLRNTHVIPIPEELLQPFRKRFGIENIQRGYGQSEANPVIVRLDDEHSQWMPNSLGSVVDGIEVKLLDDDGVEVSVGEPGEFCIKPLQPHVLFNGYFDNPSATANAYFGEWYRTGDLGMKDADGDYFFVDRKNDFIRYKGRNVSSLQVEAIVLRHPSVEAAACFGIPSDELASEDEIKIDVILKRDLSLSADELARFINDNAPYFFVPRYVEFVDSLPYTPTNKIQKYKLREKGLAGNVWDRTTTDFKIER